MKIVHRYTTIPLLLLAATTATYGDGIPVAPDRKSVMVESFTIKLDVDQVKQVERQRKLTLTEAQRAPLVAIYNEVPPTIEVVSSRWDSCTCFFGVYAIWCVPGEVQIPRYSVLSQKDDDDYKAQYPDEAAAMEENPDPDRFDARDFVLDSAGRIFDAGKEVQESELLATIEFLYERRTENSRLRCSVVLDTPPPIDEATDSRIRAIAKRIKDRCDARAIGFWAAGIVAE